MAFPQITSPPQAQAEVIVNEAHETLEHQAVYGQRQAAHTGLTWGYYGGRWGGFSVADGTLALDPSTTVYGVVERATGTYTKSTSNTNWNDTTDYARVYKWTTGAAAVTSYEDHRSGAGGVHGSGGAGGGGGSAAEGLEFTASSTTTDSDPGTGVLRWDNATQASATQLFIDNADAESTSLATLWAALTAGGTFKITDAANGDVWQLWKMTAAPVNGTGYYKFAVSLLAQEGGNIANATPILLDVDLAAVGDASTNTSSSVDSEVALFSGTGGKTIKRATGTGIATLTSGVLGSVGMSASTLAGQGSSGGIAALTLSPGLILDGTVLKLRQTICIALSDETTALTTGTAKVTFRMPFAMTGVTVRSSVTTAPTGAAFIIDINETGSTILSTKLSIDASEKTSTTAATPAVVSDSSLADDAEMTADFDQVGSTIAGAGAKLYITGYVAS